MLKNTRLANTWPWDKEWIALAFWLPSLSGFAFIYFFLPIVGKLAYCFFIINLWGLLFAIIYSYANKKLKLKKKSLQEKGLEPFDGLISFGKFQAPAAIALAKDKIYFSPIVGKELSYEMSFIKKIELKCSLPGKHLIFKVAYHLTLENDAVFAFAVSKSISDVIKPFLLKDKD